jgi:predicted TIM-barrel fold metal-dependent hydrolase
MLGDKRPSVSGLLDLLWSWLPDAKTRETVLSRNPARLYGFDRTQEP